MKIITFLGKQKPPRMAEVGETGRSVDSVRTAVLVYSLMVVQHAFHDESPGRTNDATNKHYSCENEPHLASRSFEKKVNTSKNKNKDHNGHNDEAHN